MAAAGVVPGEHFGKRDLERMGIFMEMEYLSPKIKGKIDHNAVVRGRQMYPGGPKTKEQGYFQEKFVRLFEKEALTNVFKRDLQAALASKKKNLTPMAFAPSSTPKKHSTPGDYFGTFGPKLPAFSPKPKPRVPRPKEPANALSRPGKKGGPGVADITINKFPAHMKDFYDEINVRRKKAFVEHMKGVRAGALLSSVCPQPYFHNNPYFVEKPAPYYRIPPLPKDSASAGSRFLPSSLPKTGEEGYFNKYPKAVPPRKAKPAPAKDLEKKVFYPEMRMKPTFTKSVVNHNVDMRISAKNWQTFTPVVYPASMQAPVVE